MFTGKTRRAVALDRPVRLPKHVIDFGHAAEHVLQPQRPATLTECRVGLGTPNVIPEAHVRPPRRAIEIFPVAELVSLLQCHLYRPDARFELELDKATELV